MPRFELGMGNRLSGRAGGPAAYNETRIGGGAIGAWEFAGGGQMAGQECDDAGCRGVIRNADNVVVAELGRPATPAEIASGAPPLVSIGGVFRVRAGGGRVYAMGPNGVCDTARPLAIEQDRNCIAVGADGLAADVVFQNPTSIRLVEANGHIRPTEIPGMTWSNGDDYQAFIRGGVLAHLLDRVGWVLYDVRADPPQPIYEYAAWPGYVPISWCVPVRDPQGALWLLERHELFLTMRRAEWTRGHIVAWHDGTFDNIGELYAPDVDCLQGQFLICWSGNMQEDTAGDEDRVVAMTVAQVMACEFVTFEAPTVPVKPGEAPAPPIDPNPPIEPAELVIRVRPGERQKISVVGIGAV